MWIGKKGPLNLTPVKMDLWKLQLPLLVLFGFSLFSCHCQVLELDDSFLEKRGNDPWLVEFYAPWCGHCRKLEPIYHQVSLALRSSGIRVGKVDATRFAGMAGDLGVRGYPTIIFFQGEKQYSFRGDRSKEGMVEFAKRASGPAVRMLSNLGKFRDALSDHTDQVFYVFIGDTDTHGDLYKKYSSTANKYSVNSYFYAGENKILPETVSIKNDPTILVFKDGKHFEFSESTEEANTKSDLDSWINGERYTVFPKISGGGLNEMADMNKKMVMIITDEKDTENDEQERYKEVAKSLAIEKHDTLHKHFQFLWMGESDSANSIIMTTMHTPYVLVLDPISQFYYLPITEEDPKMSTASLEKFLDDVQDGKATPYGGTGFFQRLKRVFFDLWMTVFSIYQTSGWLALIVFGVPTLVLGIVIYALCCMEPIDDSEFRSEDDDDEKDDSPEELAGESILPEGAETVTSSIDNKTGHMKSE